MTAPGILTMTEDVSSASEQFAVRDRDIVCLYGEEWETPLPTSKHHLLRHLARTNRILYVEYPLHPFAGLRHRGAFVDRLRRLPRGPREVEPGLFVLSPMCPLPYHRASPLTAGRTANSINQGYVMRNVMEATARLAMRRPIIWMYLPHAVEQIDRLHPSLVVFHVIDRYAAFSGFPTDMARLVHLALERADVVLFSSQELAKEFPPRPSYRVVRHGAHTASFMRVRKAGLRIPEELAALPRPRIGYYGALHKVDVDLLDWCASQRPAWSFVLLGPLDGMQGVRDPRWRHLPRNVHLFGPRSHGALPAHLAGWDAVMMPFRVDALTQAMSPIKFYECLAAGKPIVCTDIADVQECPGAIRTAETREAFLHELDRVLTDPPLPLPLSAVASCDWSQRFHEIETIVHHALNQHSS